MLPGRSVSGRRSACCRGSGRGHPCCADAGRVTQCRMACIPSTVGLCIHPKVDLDIEPLVSLKVVAWGFTTLWDRNDSAWPRALLSRACAAGCSSSGRLLLPVVPGRPHVSVAGSVSRPGRGWLCGGIPPQENRLDSDAQNGEGNDGRSVGLQGLDQPPLGQELAGDDDRHAE
jgi:hypothetical protein